MKSILATMLFGIMSFAVQADCVQNGRAYPEGTRIGSMVCTGSGWQQS